MKNISSKPWQMGADSTVQDATQADRVVDLTKQTRRTDRYERADTFGCATKYRQTQTMVFSISVQDFNIDTIRRGALGRPQETVPGHVFLGSKQRR